MTLTDEQCRFVVEELLGVTPDQCAALVERAERAEADAPHALARGLLVRAIASGAASGAAGGSRKTALLLLLEQRTVLRQRALLRACLGYLDDRRFFDASDWPRRALGLHDEDPLL